MSRPKAKSPAARSRKKGERARAGRSGNSSAVAGGATGGSVAVAAQHLSEPWRYALSVAAPILASFIATVGPLLLDVILIEARAIIARWSSRRSIRRLESSLTHMRLRLAEMDSTHAGRSELVAMIEAIEASIRRQEYEVVVGDLIEGPKPTPEEPSAKPSA